jgi:hypothetical protein
MPEPVTPAEPQTPAVVTPAEPATPATTPTPAEVAAQAQQAQAAAAAQPAAGMVIGGVDTTDWPDAARDAYRKRDNEAHGYQREAGDRRMQAKGAELKALRELAKQFGVEIPGDDEPADPAELKAQLAASATAGEAATRDAATARAAWANGVPAAQEELLQFKLSRSDEFKALDTTAPEFSAKVGTIVAALVAADPALKQTGTAAAAGVEQLGGANGNDAITQDKFDSMSIAEKQALYLSDVDTYRKLAG